MANGGSQIVHNTRERILSSDHNREQDLQGQSLAEILRFLLDAQSSDTNGGGVEVMGTGAESSLRGVVINGLRVRPEIGTVNTFIEAGAALVIDTASPSVDGSKAAYVVDPGVQTAGVLTLTAGSGGSVRIDVIECQRVTSVLEQDNRDIFNPATGLFTPSLVTKVSAARMAYRIRTGTPGAGFPGLAAGWMPLAVASVPAAATTWDQVTLWDVRPLASDRVNAPFDSPQSQTGVKRCLVWSDVTTVSGEVRVYGHVDAVFGGYRAGGELYSDAGAYVDVSDTDYQATGYTFPSFGFWHLWLVFPFNLPRWVRYSGATTGQRVPRGQRGIPVLSSAAARWNGSPVSTGIALPTWTGLSNTATSALLVLSGRTEGTPVPLAVTADGSGRVQTPIATALGGTIAGWSVNQTAIEATNDYVTWTFTDNVTHPGNAKAIYVWFQIEADYTTLFGSINETNAVCTYYFYVSNPDGTGFTHIAMERGESVSEFMKDGVSANTRDFNVVVRVPLAPNFAAPATARTFVVKWLCNLNSAASGTAISTPAPAQIIGWEV